MNVQGIETRDVMVKGEAFEIIVFKDVDEPFQTFFRVMRDRKLFPLKVLGGQLSFVTFSVADEIEQDAAHYGLASPLEHLFLEAERLIEVTLNG